jgi:hypothetical protein
MRHTPSSESKTSLILQLALIKNNGSGKCKILREKKEKNITMRYVNLWPLGICTRDSLQNCL